VEITTPSTAYTCAQLGSLVSPADTTPIVMTQQLPSGTLNQGTTTTTFVVGINKPGVLRWSTSNVDYDTMTNQMSVSSLTASASTGAILSNGTTTHAYVHSRFTNNVGTDITSVTALDIPITVAAGAPTDTTAPTAPTNLTAGQPFQNQVPLSWTASTDAVGVTSYQVFTDLSGLCTTFTPAGLPVTTTTTVYNLPQNLPISFVVEGNDAAGNHSSDSNCITVTTLPVTDVFPPSNMTNLRLVSAFTRSATLTSDPGTDNMGAVTTTIELATGACTDYTLVFSQLATTFAIDGLAPNTTYCARGKFSDGTNLSTAYSNVISFTTHAAGLPQDRVVVPFGTQRLPRTP
jgi:hypothetical protein